MYFWFMANLDHMYRKRHSHTSFRRSLPGSAGRTGCPLASSAIGPYSYEKVLVDGGFITAVDMRYHFFVTDHLGNVRVVVNDAGVVEQVNQFYPYGESIELDPASANPGVETITENPYKWGGKEWDEEQGAYDFGARMYSAADARWTTMDPLCEKYYSISPYSYCAGNPVNLVDPDGQDVAVLVIDGQHMALLIQNTEGGWEYYSINGDNKYLGGVHTGGRPFNELGENVFESPQAFLDSFFNQDKGDEGKEDKTIANYVYTSAYIIETDDEHIQDNTIRDEFVRISKEEPYSLVIPNHCATVVQKSLLKGGIETRSPIATGSPSGVVISGLRFPYFPSSAYKQIKKNNPGHEIFKRK